MRRPAASERPGQTPRLARPRGSRAYGGRPGLAGPESRPAGLWLTYLRSLDKDPHYVVACLAKVDRSSGMRRLGIAVLWVPGGIVVVILRASRGSRPWPRGSAN